MITGAIISALTTMLWGFLLQFWAWIVGAGLAVLGLLFSPTLRKYTIGAIAVVAVLASMFVYGYQKGFNAPHPVTPPACEDFRKVLVKGPATDKAIAIFERKGLCS
jgi:hypothetical protein